MPENQLIGNARKTDLIVEELKTYTNRRTPWKSVKYKAHNEDYSTILWSAKFPKQHWLDLKADFARQGLLDVYGQEYLNDPIDESTAFFQDKFFDKCKSVRVP